ncbi:DUF916 domain-containing protein [Brochothrix thermosphacta]|uniref:DUF916 domain-containing protein n=1 Tax=Brochothrix thermosphacta TaxID=2756 RepID=UPI000EE28482|nr:DUF916 domain-containing protein [Brochothrix thermosphacta]HCZ45487.1 hypothetical protein [Brochothrix thermosphacta]
MLKNKSLQLLMVCFLSLLFLFNPKVTFAEGSDYSVVPLLPNSQVKSTSSYYDFKVVNEEKIKLAFSIENLSEKEQTFSVGIYDAVTNKNGIIDYSNAKLKKNVKKEQRLSDLVTIPNQVTVARHAKKTIEFQIKPMKSDFDGYILGSLQIVPQKEATKAGITNLFTRTIAIRMWGTDAKETIKSNIKDNKKEFDAITETNTTLKYQLVNQSPKIEKEINVQTILEKQGDKKKIINKAERKIDFAPSSLVEQELALKEGLVDGHYKLSVNTKTAEGESFHFEYVFQMKNDKLSHHNYWLYGFSLLAALLIIFGIYLWKRKKKKRKCKHGEKQGE